MKIIVCMKEVVDTALSLDAGLRYPAVFHEGLPLRLNPADAAALAMALELKAAFKAEITLVSIGGERVESYLRNGLALGADKAVRIWEDGFDDLSPYQKAVLISGAVTVFGADLVLTGAKSADTGSGIVGQMAAARLSLPCVSDAVRVEVDQGQKSVTAVKDMGRGEREKVSCPLPAVITVKGDGKLPYASLDSLIESKSREIPALSRAELGVSEIEFKNSPTAITALTYPRPRPRKAPPLDTGLPAFYRILQLLEGGITKRKGLKLEGNSEELAERLFELLKEEGIIRPGA